jgi:outer membrane receptor protein involved in Fe transport
VESRFKSTNFTFAGRYSPLEGVTIRGSYATGFLPPSVVQISSQSLVNPFGLQTNDPLRGNEFANYPVTQVQGMGNTRLRPEESETLSFGVILTPWKELRFSADYTRITKTGEIGYADTAFVLAHPELFPGRVVRGPASDGFPVGRVTSIDISAVNLLHSEVRAVDFQLDYTFLGAQLGELRLYGLASWQPHTRRQLIAAAPEVDRTGFYDGPLEWQGNAGFDWAHGNVSVRWNTQLYASHKIYYSSDSPAIAETYRITPQGASTVPHQTYSDLFVSYDFPNVSGMLQGLRISAGMQNLFDQTPPVIAVSSYSEASYSTYGDPRLRRFSLSLRKGFGGGN